MTARARLSTLLDALAAQPGVRAALLASEDGSYLLGEMSIVVNADVLAASALSLHGAAEAALAPGSDERPLQVVAEWGSARLMTVSVGAGLALVTVLDAGADLAATMRRVDDCADEMAETVAQAMA